MEKQKKHDLWLIIGIVIIALILFVAGMLYRHFSTNHPVVVITKNGEEVGVYSLEKEKTIALENDEDEGVNVIKISGGKVDMTEASCPDQICVKHRKISKNGETIVCLPNQVVVEIRNEADVEENQVDATT